MSAGLPCPNPICPHTFPAETIRGAGALQCPRCGTRFDFRGAAPPPPAARPAPGRRVPAVPVATTVVPAVPLAAPVPPAQTVGSPDLAFDSNPGLTIAPTRLLQTPRGSWVKTLIVLLLALAATAGGIYGVSLLVTKFESRGEDASAQFEPYNFDLKVPGKSWKPDDALETRLGVRWAMSRSGPRSHVALEFIDYQEKNFPPRGKLIEEFKKHLQGYLPDFAWQPKAPATVDRLIKAGTLGKQPAYVLEFEGTHDSVVFAGECHIVEYRGFVYWLYTFGPVPEPAEARETLRGEWKEICDGFTLLNQREGWRPAPRKRSVYDGKTYEVSYPTDLWKKQEGAGLDPEADLAVQAIDTQEKGGEDSKAGKAALLQVVRLKGTKDAQSAAELLRNHFLARQAAVLGTKAENLTLTPLENRNGQKLDGPADLGKLKGHLSKNRLTTTGGTLDRFVVLAAVPGPEETIGVYCDAPFKRRDYWEQEIGQVIETLRRK
jgi:hypothetical protein